MNESEPRSTEAKRAARRRRRVRWLIGLSVLLGFLAWWFQRPLWQGNLGTVVSGRAYRSAQPNRWLDDWSKRLRLASVLNLRGGSPADSFYREERKLIEDNGLRLIEVPLSATERPSRGQMLDLIEAVRVAPAPLLIHCKQGADRTGLASAVFRMVRLGVPPREALGSFQLQHAHVPLFGTEQLHVPLEQYAGWLEARGLSHTPSRFENWIATEYVAPDRKHQATTSGLDRTAAGRAAG